MPSTYTYFCPVCKCNQNTFEQWVEGRLQVRCQACGYPVDEDVAAQDKVPLHKRKVLFIDDEKMQLQLFTDLMNQHEFHPLTALDGPSGIALAVRERPSLILIDLMVGIFVPRVRISGFRCSSRIEELLTARDTSRARPIQSSSAGLAMVRSGSSR